MIPRFLHGWIRNRLLHLPDKKVDEMLAALAMIGLHMTKEQWRDVERLLADVILHGE
jgi:hypothetical protein